jgi:hypothetical protein
VFESRLQEPGSYTSTPPGGRNADFVDPEFARLVGMPVVECRDKADDAIISNRCNEVMPRIAQERVGKTRVDPAIEHTGLDALEQAWSPSSSGRTTNVMRASPPLLVPLCLDLATLELIR